RGGAADAAGGGGGPGSAAGRTHARRPQRQLRERAEGDGGSAKGWLAATRLRHRPGRRRRGGGSPIAPIAAATECDENLTSIFGRSRALPLRRWGPCRPRPSSLSCRTAHLLT